MKTGDVIQQGFRIAYIDVSVRSDTRFYCNWSNTEHNVTFDHLIRNDWMVIS